MKDYSIEYCHTYIDSGFGKPSLDSILILRKVMRGIKQRGMDFNLVVMIDDYSPGIKDNFDYTKFTGALLEHNTRPCLIIKESALLEANKEVLCMIRDNKLKKSLVSYIKKNNKHPCSLFVASWYLMRLGILRHKAPEDGIVLQDGFKPAKQLINILPYYFEEAENLARKILYDIGGKDLVFRIHNRYFMVEKPDNMFDAFDPIGYAYKNYSKIGLQDVNVISYMIQAYKKIGHKKLMGEIGTGSNLYPILIALPFIDKIEVVEIGKMNIEYLKEQKKKLGRNWNQFIKLLRLLDPVYAGLDFQKEFSKKVVVKKGSVYDLDKCKYDIVSSHFVAESITDNEIEFHNACNMLIWSAKQGGEIIASFMEKSSGYNINNIGFPAYSIGKEDVNYMFEKKTDITFLERIPFISSPIRAGYSGIIHLNAKKK